VARYHLPRLRKAGIPSTAKAAGCFTLSHSTPESLSGRERERERERQRDRDRDRDRESPCLSEENPILNIKRRQDLDSRLTRGILIPWGEE